jgi:hypothetical protein
VGYAVHGLGFYHIPRPPLAKEKKEVRTSLNSVEGGQIPKGSGRGSAKTIGEALSRQMGVGVEGS